MCVCVCGWLGVSFPFAFHMHPVCTCTHGVYCRVNAQSSKFKSPASSVLTGDLHQFWPRSICGQDSIGIMGLRIKYKVVSLYFPTSSRSKGDASRLPLATASACNPFSTLSLGQFDCKHGCSVLLTVAVPFQACLCRSLIVAVSAVITEAADEQFNEKEYFWGYENNGFQQEWHLFSTHQYNLSAYLSISTDRTTGNLYTQNEEKIYTSTQKRSLMFP